MLPLFTKASSILLRQDCIFYQDTTSKKIEQIKVNTLQNCHTPDWKPVLETLSAHRQHMFGAKAVLDVIISSEFVRYLALPAQPEMRDSAERLAYVSASYEEIYGELAAHWQFSVMHLPPRQEMMTAAIDQTLFAALQSFAVNNHLVLRKITPMLGEVLSTNHNTFANKSGVLLHIEKSRMITVEIAAGCITQVVVFRHDDTGLEQMQSHLKRAALEMDYQHAWLHGATNLDIVALQQWKLLPIRSVWSSQTFAHMPIKQAA